MIHPSQIPFDHSILSDYSQYSFGGEQSCTYICLSAVEYFLNNYQKFRIPISSLNCQDKITLQDIDYVMQLGVSRDRRVGLTSCDDVYSTSDHFKKTLELKSIHISKLSDTLCFKQLLKEMESKSNDTKSSSDITAVVLTKPPETIAIFYDCYGYVNGKENEYYPWFIFDSHPRKYGKGGGFYLFKDLSKIEDYLKKLFIDDFDFYRKMFDSYQAKSHVMFEGTIVTLKSPIMPPKIINQPTIVQPTTTTTTIRPTTTTAQPTAIQPPTTNQQVPKNVVTTNTPMVNNTPPHVVVQNKHQQNPSHVVAQQTPPDNTQLINQLMKKIGVLEQTNRQQYEEIETLKYLLKEEQDCHKKTLHENQQLRKGTKQDHNVLDKIFSSF